MRDGYVQDNALRNGVSSEKKNPHFKRVIKHKFFIFHLKKHMIPTHKGPKKKSKSKHFERKYGSLLVVLPINKKSKCLWKEESQPLGEDQILLSIT
jgi:hypothetical protein